MGIVMGEFSLKALWTETRQSMRAKDLTDIIDKLVAWRDCPAYIRCDNGPEFNSDKLAKWAVDNRVELHFLQPSKITQNGLIERFNETLRTECLNLEWFENLWYLNEKLPDWWHTHNFVLLHSAITPSNPGQKRTIHSLL